MSRWGVILHLSGKGKNDTASAAVTCSTQTNGTLSFVPLNVSYMRSTKHMEKALQDQGLIRS